MLIQLLSILISSLLVIIGWIFVHKLNSNRDRENKRRDMVTQNMLAAYRVLEGAAEREDIDNNQGTAFEAAMADIQLFGNQEQIKCCIECIKNQEQNKEQKSEIEIAPLLKMLRADLRADLGLPHVDEQIKYCRLPRGWGGYGGGSASGDAIRTVDARITAKKQQ